MTGKEFIEWTDNLEIGVLHYTLKSWLYLNGSGHAKQQEGLIGCTKNLQLMKSGKRFCQRKQKITIRFLLINRMVTIR